MNADDEPVRRPLPQFGREAGREDTHPAGANAEPGVMHADPELVAQGWERRQMVGPERIQEWTDLYESLGFEVRVQPMTPDDFSDACRDCAAACDACVMIYTRGRGNPRRGGASQQS